MRDAAQHRVGVWGSSQYALETITYILNSISTKYVPNTPIKLWTGHKLSL